MEELPPGFRFYPTEEELVSFYLLNKLEGKRQEIDRVIKIVDIYNIEPWNLPRTHLFSFAFCCIVSAEFSGELCHGDTEQWFFFTPRQEREARGGRPNRTTASGYWKATGSPGYVYSSDNRVIGVKKTMVFYKGKAPTGRKTKWKMNEYRAIEEEGTSTGITTPKLRHEFSLCRVYVVSGSFRAFDRRPLEVTSETQHQGDTAVTSSQNTAMETQHQGGTAVTSSQNTAMVQKTSSPETSYSGGDRADPREAGGSTDWDMNDDLEQPLWEWEQLNWP